MELGKKLMKLRKASGYSQQEVAALLSRGSTAITNRAVSKWETGASLPDAGQFISLCALYGVTDVVAEFGGKGNSGPFAGLTREGIEKAKEYIDLLRLSDRYRAEEIPEEDDTDGAVRTVPLYDIRSAAGTGIFLDSDSYTPYRSASIPPDANLAVRMNDASMEPLIKNGAILCVQSAAWLDSGELGVFIFNGDPYVRRLDRMNGVKLIAENPKFNVIPVKYSYELRTVGRVLL